MNQESPCLPSRGGFARTRLAVGISGGRASTRTRLSLAPGPKASDDRIEGTVAATVETSRDATEG